MAQRLPKTRLELEDGTRHEIQADNRDMIAYDLERSRKSWPSPADGPFLWLTFCSWHALKRTGQTSDRFDVFADQVTDVAAIGADGTELETLEELEDADPTTAS